MLKDRLDEIQKIIDRVTSYLKISLPRSLETEDLKSFAFLYIIQNYHKYDSKKNFGNFIFMLAVSGIKRCLEQFNDYKRRVTERKLTNGENIHFNRLDDIQCSNNCDLIKELEKKEFYEFVNISIKRLKKVSDLHEKIFILEYLDQMTQREISQKLNIDYRKVVYIHNYNLILFRQEMKKLLQ